MNKNNKNSVFDLYGYDLDSHENAYYSEGDFEETVRQIKKIEKNNLKVNIHLNYMNIDYIDRMLSLVYELGVNEIEFYYYSLKNRSKIYIFDKPFYNFCKQKILIAVNQAKKRKINVICSKENPLIKILDIYSNYVSGYQLEKRTKEQNRIINEQEIGGDYVSSYPTKIFLELTRNCNCSCVMCGRSTSAFNRQNKNYDMPFSLFKKVADTLFPYADMVDFRGFGESLIYPHFKKVVEYSKKHSFTSQIITNLNISDKTILDVLIDNKFDIIVSFDGHEKKLFESIRRGSNFERICENIRYLTKKIDVELNTVITDLNYKHTFDIVKKGKELGVKEISLTPDRNYSKIESSVDVINKQISISKEFAKKHSIELNESFSSSTGQVVSDKICDRSWTQVYITYNGLVGPCDHRLNPPLVFGDLAKNSFENIWNNNLFYAFRKLMTKNEVCKWCHENPFYLK